ncbi:MULTISPECIES: hypothetical protein [Microbispora]|uniref:Uncharacterized protein n=1 Tax=Microbispora hainanensis TaxID=568844 RepID=A0A544Z1W1_9ACTN|nr:hypothetical protein [Microbispora hainanensis]TQS23029.1 hypothetical protein FLX08_06765 [Microbispora hainanensis]
MNTYPVESQYDLLAEHGVGPEFQAQWVDIENPHEVARRLQVASDTIVTCDLQAAVRSCSPSSEMRQVWISSLAPGWSHILRLSGSLPSPVELSLDGRRVFEITYFALIGEVDPPFYAHDGVLDVEFLAEDEYSAHCADLRFNDRTPLPEVLEQYLIVLGRITGRFLDRGWISSQGLFAGIP